MFQFFAVAAAHQILSNGPLKPAPEVKTPPAPQPSQPQEDPQETAPAPTNPNQTRIFEVDLKHKPKTADFEPNEIQDEGVVKQLKKLDHSWAPQYRDGVSHKELSKLKEFDQDGVQGLSFKEASKAGLISREGKAFLKALTNKAINAGLVEKGSKDITAVLSALENNPELLSDQDKAKIQRLKTIQQDLSIINDVLYDTEFEPNDIVFHADISHRKGKAGTDVSGYSTSAKTLDEKYEQLDKLFSQHKKKNGYKAHGTGCEAMTDVLHTSMLGKEINSSKILNEYGSTQTGDSKTTPFNQESINQLIDSGKLKPGAIIFINSDPEMKLAGESGKGKSLGASDRHWFTYMGNDDKGTPLFLDQFGEKRTLKNMAANFPEKIPTGFGDFLTQKGYPEGSKKRSDLNKSAHESTRKALQEEYKAIYRKDKYGAKEEQKLRAEIEKNNSQAEYTSEKFEAELNRRLEKKWVPHKETMIFDNPGGRISIHSMIDLYSDETPSGTPGSRADFESVATRLIDK